MRLLVVTTVGRTISAFLEPQIAELQARHEVVLLCSATEEVSTELAARFELVDAPWRRPFRPARLPRTVAEVRRTLKQIDPDCIYVHTAIAATLTRLALVGSQRPRLVYCAHGFDGAAAQPWLRRTASRTIERLLSRWTDLILVMNDEDERWARSLRSTQIVRIPSVGLDVARWSQVPPADIDAAPAVLVSAELIPRKRVDLAIRAMAHLPDDVTLVIAGDGPLRDQLETLTADLDLRERVRFAGHVADIGPYLRDCHLMLSCSRQEGLSRSVLEAFAAGRPVVALDARGVTDLLRSGGGRIVEGVDPARIATAVESLLDDGAAYSDASTEARRLADRHDLAVVVPEIVGAIESIGR